MENGTGTARHEDSEAVSTNDGPYPTSHHPDVDCGKCNSCKKAKRDRRMYRLRLMAALLFPFTLATLDLTVIATALEYIAVHFHKTNQLEWIITSYSLTSAAFVPAFGQLSHAFGRHTALQFAVLLMVLGSVLCAASQTWVMLLFGRAFQGTGTAGITSVISIVLTDKVSLRENARNNTIFQLVASTAYGWGPVAGGYLTDSSWRWCFILSIPIAAIANVVIFILLRKDMVGGTHSVRRSFREGLLTIDVGGTAIFVISVCLIILGTAWGGSTYPWNSAAVIVPLVLGGLLFVAFPVYEYLLEPGKALNRRFPNQMAMVPFPLYRKLDLVLITFIQLAAGMAIYSVFYYSAIYFVLVEGYSASKAGTQLLYYIPGLGVGSYLAMFMCNTVYPGSTFWPLMFGAVIETIGIGMIAYSIGARQNDVLCGMMGLAGVGTGLRFMPCNLHVTGIWPQKRAQALSMTRFALPFGGTLAFTIMGAVYSNLGGLSGGISAIYTGSAQAVNGASPAELNAFKESQKHAIKWAYISILPVLVLSVMASLLLGNVYIRTKDQTAPQKEQNGIFSTTTTSQTTMGQSKDVPSSGLKKGKYEPYIVYFFRWAYFRLTQKGASKPDSKSVPHQANEEPSQNPTDHDDVEKIASPPSLIEAVSTKQAAMTSYVLSEPYLLALMRGRKYLESRKEAWSLE